MAIRDSLLPEFDHETGTTRRLLERLPEERFGWKPHQKSMSLGRLATHVAELTSWGSLALSATEFNMPAGPYQPVEKATRDEVLGLFDENVAALRRQLENISDGELMVMWTFKSGGQPVFSQPRIGVLRTMVMNHLIHHRGQLSVYLRQNDVPLPSIYGPSADERG
jgi:uncharacterized damage-inducible protein DinB